MSPEERGQDAAASTEKASREEVTRARSRGDRRLQGIALVFMMILYGIILTNAGRYTERQPLNLTFNNMLAHLLHRQFYVDPDVVGFEGFLRDGHVYSYWGITCALLRLPLLLFHRLDLDVTVWSCLVAVCLAGMMKLRTVLLIRRRLGYPPASSWAFGLMMAYIFLGGAEIGYLKASIFQEVIFWAVAFAAVFIYFAIMGLVRGYFSLAVLSSMAAAAGLATLTRVSTGIGLCAAFGLLLLVLLAEDLRSRTPVRARRFLVPAGVLAAFLAVVGVVNTLRWGAPWTFTNYAYYVPYHVFPARMERMRLYGLFNPERIPFGLGYYFFPLWAFHRPDGRLFFESTHLRLMEVVELPPSSLFLTDLLPFAFVALLAVGLWARRSVRPRSARESVAAPPAGVSGMSSPAPQRTFPLAPAAALAVGLAAPCILMLMPIFMSYRYRMEFYPELDLLAFLGLSLTASDPDLLARFNRLRRWMIAALAVTIASAFASMALYKLSHFGPSLSNLRNGVAHYYLHDALHAAREKSR
jgi:hypothetical protein